MNRNETDNRNRNEDSTNSYMAAGAVAAGVAALAGGIYWLAKGKQPEPCQEHQGQNQSKKKVNRPQPSQTKSIQNKHPTPEKEGTPIYQYMNSLLNRMASNKQSLPSKVANKPPPDNPCISNLNALLSDIHVRFIQIKNEDFQLHYKVFDKIFQQLHQRMKDVDPYYRKYSSSVQFAGSHYDNLRIKKPDEFDMDIVIGLPLNLEENSSNPTQSDIYIEPKAAGYVQLRMGVQFQKLPLRDGVEWLNNKAAYKWMDGSNYLMRSKFLDWFKGVVDKALEKFEIRGGSPVCQVDDVLYVIGKSESGPAVTLIMENKSKGFRLDVDLVPALKFPERRWPVGPSYRHIPTSCSRGEWMVVGKPIKNGILHDEHRSWRIALHNQERKLMHDSYNLRQAVRLLKKLRDALGMKKIASYYIKTLFFWEIDRHDKGFWQKNNPAFLFKLMVGRLHAALINKKIPYYWNKGNNLIWNVNEKILYEYAAKLVPLMQVLEITSEYKKVAKFLLTPDEFRPYNAKFLHI